jgi:hypothetical protein
MTLPTTIKSLSRQRGCHKQANRPASTDLDTIESIHLVEKQNSPPITASTLEHSLDHKSAHFIHNDLLNSQQEVNGDHTTTINLCQIDGEEISALSSITYHPDSNARSRPWNTSFWLNACYQPRLHGLCTLQNLPPGSCTARLIYPSILFSRRTERS